MKQLINASIRLPSAKLTPQAKASRNSIASGCVGHREPLLLGAKIQARRAPTAAPVGLERWMKIRRWSAWRSLQPSKYYPTDRVDIRWVRAFDHKFVAPPFPAWVTSRVDEPCELPCQLLHTRYELPRLRGILNPIISHFLTLSACLGDQATQSFGKSCSLLLVARNSSLLVTGSTSAKCILFNVLLRAKVAVYLHWITMFGSEEFTPLRRSQEWRIKRRIEHSGANGSSRASRIFKKKN